MKIRNEDNTLTIEYQELVWDIHWAVHKQRAITASAALAANIFDIEAIAKAIEETKALEKKLVDLARVRNMMVETSDEGK